MKLLSISVTSNNALLLFLIFCSIMSVKSTKDPNEPGRKTWKDKDIRDMSEADLEHIFDQWEENDEPLESDELPSYLRPSPQIDLSKIDMSNPDNVLKETKRGKELMMFVDVQPDIPTDKASAVLQIWQTSLQNNHILVERYPIEERRAIFMFREGSQAVDAKNYLVNQPELHHLTLEGQTYKGKYTKDERMDDEL